MHSRDSRPLVRDTSNSNSSRQEGPPAHMTWRRVIQARAEAISIRAEASRLNDQLMQSFRTPAFLHSLIA